MKNRFAFLILALGSNWNIQAQGGSAIITLVMPPPDADGYQSLQSGGAFPDGSASLYYNPADLAELQRSTGSQLFFSQSSQNLLPVLQLPDLQQNFWGLAAVAPDSKSGYDVGVGFFHDAVDFGQNLGDSNNFSAKEFVDGIGIGLRLGIPVSVGGTAKFFQSDLSSNGSANGWAFDFGMLADPHFHTPKGLRFPYFEFTPSASCSFHNLGPDVTYVPGYYDPLPTELDWSFGLRLSWIDLAEISVGQDREYSIYRETLPLSPPTKINGFEIDILGIQVSRSHLEDSAGQRNEHHSGIAYAFNALRIYRLLNRFRSGDFDADPQNLDAGFPFRTIQFAGISFRANPRITLGIRKIEATGSIRDGQRAEFFSVSL